MSLPSHTALLTLIALNTLLLCTLPDANNADIHQVIDAPCRQHLRNHLLDKTDSADLIWKYKRISEAISSAGAENS